MLCLMIHAGFQGSEIYIHNPLTWFMYFFCNVAIATFITRMNHQKESILLVKYSACVCGVWCSTKKGTFNSFFWNWAVQASYRLVPIITNSCAVLWQNVIRILNRSLTEPTIILYFSEITRDQGRIQTSHYAGRLSRKLVSLNHSPFL